MIRKTLQILKEKQDEIEIKFYDFIQEFYEQKDPDNILNGLKITKK